MVETFASKIGTTLTGKIPRSEEISRAEAQRKTAVELFPDGAAAEMFRALAKEMLADHNGVIPAPMPEEELEKLCRY